MSTAPNISLIDDTASYRQPPHNVEAEQALLGAILINNEALNHIGDFLRPEHFYEPIHTRIFEAILKFHDRGQVANPVTLRHFFDQDAGLAELGGGQYLARLAGAAMSIINVYDYSATIYDLALKRQLITIGEDVVNIAYASEIDQTATVQIETAEQKLFHLSTSGAGEKSFRAVRHALVNAVSRAESAYKNNGKVVGVSSGLRDLDRLLGGLQRSDLLILAGRPSMGKTALATSIAYNAAKILHDTPAEQMHDKKKASVGFFSLEMSAEQLATRILSGACNINSSKLLRGEIDPNHEFPRLVQTSNHLASLPFFIDDTPALSISALRTRARRLKRTHNLGMLVVDYLQLVRASNVNSQTNRVQEVSEITQGLKAIAKELDIPVIALSQLSRAVEQRDDKRPQLSDLRESGSIEQDADVVMFVYREEYYLGRKQPRDGSPEMAAWQAEMEKVHGLADVIVAKQRNGPIGTVTLAFQSDFTRFSDWERPAHMPERVYE